VSKGAAIQQELYMLQLGNVYCTDRPQRTHWEILYLLNVFKIWGEIMVLLNQWQISQCIFGARILHLQFSTEHSDLLMSDLNSA